MSTYRTPELLDHLQYLLFRDTKIDDAYFDQFGIGKDDVMNPEDKKGSWKKVAEITDNKVNVRQKTRLVRRNTSKNVFYTSYKEFKEKMKTQESLLEKTTWDSYMTRRSIYIHQRLAVYGFASKVAYEVLEIVVKSLFTALDDSCCHIDRGEGFSLPEKLADYLAFQIIRREDLIHGNQLVENMRMPIQAIR